MIYPPNSSTYLPNPPLLQVRRIRTRGWKRKTIRNAITRGHFFSHEKTLSTFDYSTHVLVRCWTRIFRSGFYCCKSKIRFLIKKFAYFFLLCRGTLHVLGGCKMLDTFWLHTELWMLFVRLVLEASLNMWAECRYFWLVLYSIWFVWLFYLSGHPIRTSPTSFSSSQVFGELQMQCGKRKSMVRFKIYFCIYWNSALKWKSTLKFAH